jgi:hypothetical protein
MWAEPCIMARCKRPNGKNPKSSPSRGMAIGGCPLDLSRARPRSMVTADNVMSLHAKSMFRQNLIEWSDLGSRGAFIAGTVRRRHADFHELFLASFYRDCNSLGNFSAAGRVRRRHLLSEGTSVTKIVIDACLGQACQWTFFRGKGWFCIGDMNCRLCRTDFRLDRVGAWEGALGALMDSCAAPKTRFDAEKKDRGESDGCVLRLDRTCVG